MTVFLDTNILLRFFTGDDPAQAQQAQSLFQQSVRGEIRLVVGPPVLFELVWTLRKAYNVTREETFNILEALCSMSGIRLLDRELVELAILLGRHHAIEFADAYIVATVQLEEVDALATFNWRHFHKVGIRMVPEG